MCPISLRLLFITFYSINITGNPKTQGHMEVIIMRLPSWSYYYGHYGLSQLKCMFGTNKYQDKIRMGLV